MGWLFQPTPPPLKCFIKGRGKISFNYVNPFQLSVFYTGCIGRSSKSLRGGDVCDFELKPLPPPPFLPDMCYINQKTMKGNRFLCISCIVRVVYVRNKKRKKKKLAILCMQRCRHWAFIPVVYFLSRQFLVFAFFSVSLIFLCPFLTEQQNAFLFPTPCYCYIIIIRLFFFF